MNALRIFSLVSLLLLPTTVLAQGETDAPDTPEATTAETEVTEAAPAEAATEVAAETETVEVEKTEVRVKLERVGDPEITVEDPDGKAVVVETITEDGDSSKKTIEVRVRRVEEEAPSFWSPAIDTRLTFVIADDNLLAGPGETTEPSPGPQLHADGDSNNLFFESYDSKDSGFDNLSHLVLYKESPTFFKGLVGAAALVLRLDVGAGGTSISDSSSYVQLRYHPETWGEKESISFTGFPVSSDRFLLGYSYRLTWGGSRIFIQGTKVPGARLQVTRDRWYAWMGAKTAVLSQTIELGTEQNTELKTNYGGLLGFGVDLIDELRVEGGAGYFTRGTFARESVRGEKLWAAGGSGQVAWHVGRDVGTSIDLRLYQNDPEKHQNFFKQVKYDDGMDWVLKAELSYLVQNLEDIENYGSTVAQKALAGDINFAMRLKRHRFFADLVFQDMSFILFNVPSLVPYVSYADAMEIHPEWFFAASWDYHFPKLHLTPGLRFGVQNPAYAMVEAVAAGPNPAEVLTGQRAVVVRRAGEFNVLPEGEEAVPVFAFQANAKLDISEFLSAIGEVSFEVDNNRSTFRQSTAGETIAVFVEPYVLSFNLVLQARF